MEVTRAVFARMCGISKTAVTKGVQAGHIVMNSGKRIETEHPQNKDYMTQKQNKMRDKIQGESKSAVAPGIGAHLKTAASIAQSEAVNVSGAPEQMLSMTIRELVATYGGTNGVEKYAKILQILTTSNEKDLRIQERRLTLIPKDFVTSRMFGYLDQLMAKLLDWPDSAVDTIVAKSLSGKEDARGEIVTYMRSGLTRCICDAKDHILYEINSLRAKYDTSADELEDLKEKVSEISEKQNLDA